MLNSETRRRIDTARDILVGKVPDPKSQVEQITIALVYKFMDDMDKQSIEMGGKASFFKGEFKKYGWSEIFNPRMGGIEMLNLYGEAITRMSQNDNLPELFRNIFKNAFLPYRDPETLKLFLKTINEFSYDHSEKLGDAFEYLLSVLGSQGDAGQFRTPRHIIDFMVRVLDPKKTETILDPACGTAGFLISAYKHIVNTPSGFATSPKSDGVSVGFGEGKGEGLTAQEKQAIYNNFTGYDISPDMVRLSLVNMYLHGFVKPNIQEYDTLTSEDNWDRYFNVILANPPFMSPKGGIKPHKRFSVQSNRSEVLFVDYMAEHLTPNGRAAIIVPEGIIFQSAGAYKQLRKYLIEHNFLWAVVSLPAGVFNPYAGVKTSILFLDKALAKKTDQILFVKVEADGFDLGAQRRPIDRNDLPDALNTLHAWQKAVLDGNPASFSPTIASALLVSTSRLAENEDYNLSADRHREVKRVGKQTYPMVSLGELCEILDSKRVPIRESERKKGEYPYYGATGILDYVEGYLFDEKLVLVGEDGAKWDKGDKTAFIAKGKYWVNNHAHVLRPKRNLILDEYLVGILVEMDLRLYITGVTVPKLNQEKLRSIEIPLPPLETQRQIVDEIAAHQRIIDGARQVVEGWKPNFDIDPLWTEIPLGEVITLQRGYDLPKQNWVKGNVPIVGSNGIIGYHNVPKEKGPGVVTGRSGTIGKVHFINSEYYWPHNTSLFVKEFNGHDRMFIKLLLESIDLKSLGANVAAVPSLDRKNAHRIMVSVPPLEIQREIVARIERERSIVEGNRELIRVYEEKVKKVIERVWEE
ncbi:MAG: N-6 DNA methylase [Chloroflexi bacterium]|nr:N-6 DNA methylase [Chloroflexota bacterium]